MLGLCLKHVWGILGMGLRHGRDKFGESLGMFGDFFVDDRDQHWGIYICIYICIYLGMETCCSGLNFFSG